MRRVSAFGLLVCVATALVSPLIAQQKAAQTQAISIVPRLVNLPGRVLDAAGKPVAGPATVTFAIYREEEGGEAIWRETQNVQADANGNFTAQLGATEPNGLALDLFNSGEPRWLGTSVNGGNEKPRALLLSVPFALKAADAETVGGYPASAFVMANTSRSNGVDAANSATSVNPRVTNPAITGKGTAGSLAAFDSASDIVNSSISQSGTSVGILTTAPAAALDVNGTTALRNTLTLVPHATDNALALYGTKFSVGPTGLVNFVGAQTYPGAGTIHYVETASGSGLQGGGSTATVNLSVKPGGITNTMLQNPGLTLNTSAPLTGGGSVALGGASATLTLVPCPAGQVLISNGTSWSCTAAAGTGKVTSVGLSAPASDFTVSSSPVTTAGTLALNWNAAPTPTSTANAIVKRDANGNFSANYIVGSLGLEGDSTNGTGVTGYSGSTIGVYGESDGSVSGANGVQGNSYGAGGSGVAGFNSQGGIGVYGQGTTGVFAHGTVGFGTDSNAQQSRSAGGWVKAMVNVNGYQAPYSITQCYNSTLTGSAATTPPCGIDLEEQIPGAFTLDFNFEVDDRFFSATLTAGEAQSIAVYRPSAKELQTITSSGDNIQGGSYTLIVF